jgi:multidrug efflux pump
VRTALAAANVNQPKGSLDGPRQDYTLATNDQLDQAAGWKDLVLAYKNGAPIRLSQVADVADGVENAQLAGWAGEDKSIGMKRAIILNVQRQPGANVLAVAESVKSLLPQLAASMPQGIDVHILTDRTETVRASVDDVRFTLILTVFLVVLVIYVFLRSLRATIIPGVAVPLSLIATFGVMKLCGYSLNNLSLMALTISTGFVVDDAIVMVENISRFIEEGEKPFLAALKGAKQIGFTILSLTVSLIAVLIPLLFMGGLIGRLFREFAVTLSIAIAISAVLSLTLTAMMCGWLLKGHGEPEGPTTMLLVRIALRILIAIGGGLGAYNHRHTPFASAAIVAAAVIGILFITSRVLDELTRTTHAFGRLFERGYDAMAAFYDRTLKWVLAHQKTTLIATIATVAFTGLLAVIVPKGFFPVEDTGLVIGVSEAAPDVSFSRMMERQEALANVLLQDPDVATVASFIGADGTNATTNSGRFSIALKPREDRKSNANDIIRRLTPQLAAIDGITLYLQPVQDLQIDNRLARTQYQYTLEDADPKELADWAPRVLDKLKTLPQLSDVASDQQESGLALSLTIDRDTAGRLGVTPQAIDDTLYDAFGQRIVSTIFTQLNLYRVILEVKSVDQQSPEALEHIYVKSGDGNPVPLSAFAHYETKSSPLSISHQGQFPAVTLSFNTARDVSLGSAVEAIRQAENEVGMPASIRADFQGSARAFQESLASEPLLLLAAILTVYIVLGVLYESYIHPITILSTLPSAGVGALLALIICGADFGIIALIGVVLLVGIVKKNAIMMIDFALEAERDQKLSPEQSIYKACLLRFRPIMMTTMAALLGALPLALGTGTGSELRRPLGITIVGGLLLSQVLTLYTTPVIYLYMEKLARLLKRKQPTVVSAVSS